MPKTAKKLNFDLSFLEKNQVEGFNQTNEIKQNKVSHEDIKRDWQDQHAPIKFIIATVIVLAVFQFIPTLFKSSSKSKATKKSSNSRANSSKTYPKTKKTYKPKINNEKLIIHYSSLGLDAFDNENYSEAITNIDTALGLVNKGSKVQISSDEALLNATLYLLRGRSNYMLGNDSQAEKDLENSLYYGSQKGAYFVRGSVRASLGKHIEAISDFSQSIQKGENLKYSYFNRGYSYLKSNQFKNATNDFNLALAYGYQRADTLRLRGMAHAFQGAYQLAKDDFAEAKEIYINNGNNYGYKNLTDTVNRIDQNTGYQYGFSDIL